MAIVVLTNCEVLNLAYLLYLYLGSWGGIRKENIQYAQKQKGDHVVVL